MSKVVLDPVQGGYDLSVINNNFDKIETELNEKALYRDNPEGEPNQMNNSLDMNGFDLINVDTLQVADLTVDGENVTGLVQLAADTLAAAQDEVGYAEEWAQSALPISVEAGGDGLSDRSAKFWAEEAEASIVTFDFASVLPSSQRFAVGGSTQSVDLGDVELHPEAIRVFINGVYQFTDTWSLLDGVLSSVDSSWPGDALTTNMEVLVDATTALAFNVPSLGSVSTDRIADKAVTSDKLADSFVNGIEALATSAVIPSGFNAARYLQLQDYRCKKVAQQKNIYNAFPGGPVRLKDSVVSIYSSGVGHGVSSRQIWVRSDDDMKTFSSGTFLENSTGAYDNTFLSDLLEEGESVNFKSVFTVKKVGGLLENFTTSVVVVTDPYALWGEPVFIDGAWFTTGYRTSGGFNRPALFTSTDGMETWSFVGLIASSGILQLNEASILKLSNGEWIAAIRDSSQPTRDMYLARTADPFTNQPWETINILPSHVKGTQPNLVLLANGDIILLAGKRTGSSGLTTSGNHTDNEDITGLVAWKSTDNGATWGAATMLLPSWSTDCGQPRGVVLPNGNLGVMGYTAPGATSTGNVGVQPGIYWIEVSPSDI